MKKCKSILLLSLSLVLLSFTLVGCGDNANNNDGSTGTTTQAENNTADIVEFSSVMMKMDTISL